MAYIPNVFAYLTVWLNLIRIEAKIGKYVNIYMASWILFMWDQMMPKALNDFIKKEEVRAKLEWQVKENTALNLVYNFLKDGNLDAQLRTLIRLNHNFYRFIYSNLINLIYFNTKEVHIQERFVSQFNEWQAKAAGGWLSPPVNSYDIQPPPPPPPPMTPAPTMTETLKPTMVDIQLPRKIDPAPLTENERKAIMKKQKRDHEKIELELKLEEMTVQKKIQKLSEKEFKMKKKKRCVNF